MSDTQKGKPEFLNGEKFKNAETEAQTYLPAHSYAAVRVDGKGFSRFTKAQGYSVPFCDDFRAIMDYTAEQLLRSVDGAIFAYVQSDEISVIFSDHQKDNTEWWHGGKVQKIVSLTAANASVAYARKEWERSGNSGSTPIFDSRVFALADRETVEEYIRWRRFDAQKNSVSMAAGSKFSHKQLLGISSKDRAEMLNGTELEHLPEWFYNGRIVYRELGRHAGFNPVTGKSETSTRRTLKTVPATREFMEDDFIELTRTGYVHGDKP